MRVSFLGGGTDFPEYFLQENHVGRVLGTTIDKYVYAYALNQPKFETVKIRFNYRTSESVESVSEIQHPVVREALKLYKWNQPINIGTMADLPGRSGLGSSSAFTVAFVALLETLNHNLIDAPKIARLAIRIEREILEEEGGYQDQIQAATGGFRLYEFSKHGIDSNMEVPNSFTDYLGESLVLYAPTESRSSKDFARFTKQSIDQIKANGLQSVYTEMSELSKEVYFQLCTAESNEKALLALSGGMNEAWKMKTKIVPTSSSDTLEIINTGLRNGALAGKLCGAGGTGFVAFLVPNSEMKNFSKKFDQSNLVFPKPTLSGVTVFSL